MIEKREGLNIPEKNLYQILYFGLYLWHWR